MKTEVWEVCRFWSQSNQIGFWTWVFGLFNPGASSTQLPLISTSSLLVLELCLILQDGEPEAVSFISWEKTAEGRAFLNFSQLFQRRSHEKKADPSLCTWNSSPLLGAVPLSWEQPLLWASGCSPPGYVVGRQPFRPPKSLSLTAFVSTCFIPLEKVFIVLKMIPVYYKIYIFSVYIFCTYLERNSNKKSKLDKISLFRNNHCSFVGLSLF